MERPGVIPIKTLASFTKGLPHQAEDLPPLPEPTLRQRVSDLGREWTETIGAPARSGESTIYSEKGPEEVAQAAQVKGLPDLDHACYFLAVSAAVSVAVAAAAPRGRLYDLERPRVQAPRFTEAVREARLQSATVPAAVDEQRAGDGPINLDAVCTRMQGTGHLRELQGDSRFTTTPPAPRYVLEVRQGLAKAGPRFCLPNLGYYHYIPAESRTLRIKDVSQATRCGFREVERPQLCAVKKT